MNCLIVLEASSISSILVPILLMIGGLGALFVGMNMLQSSTEKMATSGLKKLFAKTAKSKFAGVGIGTLATMIMQSSGATTIMVVGFVNAGVMSLAQAATYIMVANIGTTITAQIVALGGLSSSVFPLTEIIISLTLVGVIMRLLFKKKFPKVAFAGDMITGLGLLFLGLETMTANMQSLFLSNEALKSTLISLTNPFLLLLIGIVLTVLAQSSSAVTSIVLALAMAGAVIGGSGNGVLYLVLGSNIGSCSTALLSAIGSTTNGKRTAIIHLLFNVFGSLIFFIVLLCWPKAMESTFAKWFPSSPATQIAMFHTFFNVLTTILFLPLTRFLVFLATKIIPEKGKGNETDLLDGRFLSTPELALTQAISYYHIMAKLSLDDLNMALLAFLNKDESKKEEIDALENKVLHMSKELSGFLVQIAAKGVSEESQKRISRMLLDIADIIRFTEVADNITGYTRHEVEDDLSFSPVVLEDVKEMQILLNKMFEEVDKIVDKPSIEQLNVVRKMEDGVDNKRTSMVQGHLKRLENGECKPQNSNVFINLVGNLERCGDHLNFIAERSSSDILPKGEEDTITLHP